MWKYRAPMLVLLLVACGRGVSVTWGDIVRQGAPAPPREFPGSNRPVIDGGCEASLRVAAADGSAFGAWWQPRSDSSSVLMVARAMDGGAWQRPVVADSTDRSARGCGRPPPAIAADLKSGYVHLAYFIEPTSGPGVFFTHSMDSGATFHASVPVVFGKNPARVSIDSEGERVAVVYEDPNSVQPMLGLALSSTMGHIFERGVSASSPNGRARQPIVRLDGDSIRLWWSEYSANPAVSATKSMYRSGYIAAQR